MATVWDPVSLAESEWHRWDVGPLSLWGRKVEDEFHLVTDLVDESCLSALTRADVPPESNELQRWILKRELLMVDLQPAMPDRAVVVRPEIPIRFPSGRKACIYVSIPVTVRVRALQGAPIVLGAYATKSLSNTWFGDPLGGTLAYALASRARRKREDLALNLHRAVCPVQVINESCEELQFQQFCLRVEHLAVYLASEHLWTGDVVVRYRGEEKGSQIEYRDGPPAEASEAVQRTDPAEPVNRSIFRRSFTTLFKWASDGIAGS